MRPKSSAAMLIWIVFLMAPAFAPSQTAQQSGTLAVSGHSGEAPVIQAGGRSYVDIEALARLTSGSLSFNGNQVILTLPGTARAARPATPPAKPPAPAGLSRDFMKAGIEAMAEIREWRSALEGAVRYGFPPGDSWLSRYRGSAATSVTLASAAATTDDDRKTFQLLDNEFNNMQKLSDKMLSTRKSMTYIAPDALQSDPLDQKILACGQALASMAAAGQFQDAASCH